MAINSINNKIDIHEIFRPILPSVYLSYLLTFHHDYIDFNPGASFAGALAIRIGPLSMLDYNPIANIMECVMVRPIDCC